MGLYLQSPEVLLLEELLDEVPDKQKDDGADEGTDDLAVPLSPEGAVGADKAKQPAADEASQEADDDVPDQAAFFFDHEESGKPAGDGSEEQGKKDVHVFNAKWFMTNITIFRQKGMILPCLFSAHSHGWGMLIIQPQFITLVPTRARRAKPWDG